MDFKTTDPEMVKVTFYLPEGVRRKLKSVAALEGITMSEMVTNLVRQHLVERSKEKKPAEETTVVNFGS